MIRYLLTKVVEYACYCLICGCILFFGIATGWLG